MWRVVVGLLLASPAWAASGLQWKWTEGQTRRWLLKSEVELAEPMDFLGRLNVDTRISKFTLTGIVACTATFPLGKRGWELRCDIEHASLTAVALPSHVGRVGVVVEEWVRVAEGESWLQVVQRPDGRLSSVHLEGVDRSNDRFQRVAEWTRQMWMRALAPLDIHLPKKGEAEGVWPQKGGLAFAAPSFTGGIGAVLWTHTLQPGDGPVVAWTDDGRGTIQPGGEYVESSMMTLSMSLSGSGRFDTADGSLEESQYRVVGTATASSMQAEAGRNPKYVQTSYAQRLADGVVPALPPSGEVR